MNAYKFNRNAIRWVPLSKAFFLTFYLVPFELFHYEMVKKNCWTFVRCNFHHCDKDKHFGA